MTQSKQLNSGSYIQYKPHRGQLEEFEVVPLTKEILKQARSLKNIDYEDLIQYFSAINSSCNFIITRNKNDFPQTGVKVLSPSEFLLEL